MKFIVKLLSATLILAFISSSCSIQADRRQHVNGYKLKITKGKNDSKISENTKSETKEENRKSLFPTNSNTELAENNTVKPVTESDLEINKKTETVTNLTAQTSKSTADNKIETPIKKIGALKAFKQLKKSLKNMEDESSSGGDVTFILLFILAIILPPLAVYFVKDIGTEFWISLILTLLFWLPGIVYAMLIIFDVI